MPKQIISTYANVANDAALRSWGSAHNAALAAAGLVQTADTGQVNWTTVLRPTGAGVSIGYEVWRFSDALQATAPIFLRLAYFSGSGGAQNATVQSAQVGTGSNGAGSITGASFSFTPSGYSLASAFGTGVTPSYIAHPAGSLSIVFNHGALTSVAVMALTIDRTRDALGAATGEGAYAAFSRYNGTVGTHTSACNLNFETSSALAIGPCSAIHPNDLTSMASGNSVYVFRHFATLPHPRNVVAALSYLNPEIAPLTTFAATPVGATEHTYLTLGNNASNAACNGGQASANAASNNEGLVCLAVRWED